MEQDRGPNTRVSEEGESEARGTGSSNSRDSFANVDSESMEGSEGSGSKASMANVTDTDTETTKQLDTETVSTQAETGTSAEGESIDGESERGRFGWVQIEGNHVPFLMRSKEKYICLRMLEKILPAKLFNCIAVLDKKVYQDPPINSFYVTEAEIRLLNEINLYHCDCYFGLRLFTSHDRLVKLADIQNFFDYLYLCYDKLVSAHPDEEVCGFVKIGSDYVPYSTHDEEIVVPFFYFEGDTEPLEVKTFPLKGWPLLYLKFCFRVQGVMNTFFDRDSLVVARLRDIKSHFPPGTTFQLKWPPRKDRAPLLKNDNRDTSSDVETSFLESIRKPTDSPIVMTPEAAMRIFSSTGPDGSVNNPISGLLMSNSVSITRQPSSSRGQHISQVSTLPLQSHLSGAEFPQINLSEKDEESSVYGKHLGNFHRNQEYCNPSGKRTSTSEPAVQTKAKCDIANGRPSRTHSPKTKRKKSNSQRRYCEIPSLTYMLPRFATLVRS